jgi:hypothetical protein
MGYKGLGVSETKNSFLLCKEFFLQGMEIFWHDLFMAVKKKNMRVLS